MITIQQALAKVIEREDLSRDQMTAVMKQIMTGEASDAQIGGFLVALRCKGETVNEIVAAASVMRELAAGVSIDHDNLVDIVGTGGDGSSTFNISTASMFVVAAAGGIVAKHGNRSVSSKSGSADLLEKAGVRLDLTPQQVEACINETGVGFMFALMHHSAMKHAIGPRKEMAIRTIFNILGPLTNPAGAQNMLLGVYDKLLVRPLAQVLKELGAKHVMVVHSEDGMDEISIATKTDCCELKNGAINCFSIDPIDYGVAIQNIDSIRVDDAQQSLAMIQSVFANESGPAMDIVTLNAGAAIYVAGLADDIQQGVDLARKTIASGLAQEKMNSLAKQTQSF